MSTNMTRKLPVIAMLTVLIGAMNSALAASGIPGASVQPHVSIRPPVVRPSVHPRAHIPSISQHVGKQLMNKRTNTAPVGGLTTTEQGDSAAMLLPAVQAAREAARKLSSNAGKGKGKYYQYELKNVYVTSY